MSATKTTAVIAFTTTRTKNGAKLTRDDGRMLTPAVREITFHDSGIAANYVRYFHGAAPITFVGYGA